MFNFGIISTREWKDKTSIHLGCKWTIVYRIDHPVIASMRQDFTLWMGKWYGNAPTLVAYVGEE